jgi:NitT/TauT family transport system ATP-binding protein
MARPQVCLRARDLVLGHRARRGEGFTLACDQLNLEIAEHEFVVIVGPSGCGKSTFLEAVAGLNPVAGGALELDGKPITGPGPERSLVFQQSSLFPWRTVLDNVLFGPQMQGGVTPAVRKRATDLLEVAGLAKVADKFPQELSGGMKQRVNLARALAVDPRLLLLDEPFGALDAQTRENLQEELLRIWQADGAGAGKTALFVTHDVNEAVLLADRVIMFSSSPATVAKVLTIDAPRPRDAAWRRSAQFIAYGDEILAALHGGPTASDTASDEVEGHDDGGSPSSDQPDDTARASGGAAAESVGLGATAP